MNSLTTKELIFISFMLFSMFFGAGNLIFPAFLGYSSGSDVWVSLAGLVITAVGLPILGVIAVGKAGSLKTLATRVHPLFALVFPILIYLSIGPGLAIPRAGTISFEMGMKPFLSADANETMMLFVYTLVFFSIVLWLSLTPSKLVDRFGKLLTPILLILVAIIFVKSLISPIDSFSPAVGSYAEIPFFQGFLDGYLTMDALAALVYGIVVVNTIRAKGVTDSALISKYMQLAGLGAGILLTAIYGVLAYLGASSSGLGDATNGTEVLTLGMDALFGQAGIVLLGVLFILACLCVSISLVISCSQYFSELLPFMSYKGWAVVMAVLSLGIANLGLNQILAISVPILGAIYPLAIVLIALGLLNRYVNNTVYLWTMIFTGIFSIVETINHSFLGGALDGVLSFFPLYTEGVGWIIPAIVGALVGMIVHKMKQ
ncbi:branched-chain amino acid transport system II carrier protein [Solibacillus sp. FSL H8-0538]|uniref:branched-chain amino acid transport system II carrier protein n=1 Tax=Solibacillus sp. FSL H8-0538 TaxID=2921400 RepID=UPI0030FD1C6C